MQAWLNEDHRPHGNTFSPRSIIGIFVGFPRYQLKGVYVWQPGPNKLFVGALPKYQESVLYKDLHRVTDLDTLHFLDDPSHAGMVDPALLSLAPPSTHANAPVTNMPVVNAPLTNLSAVANTRTAALGQGGTAVPLPTLGQGVATRAPQGGALTLGRVTAPATRARATVALTCRSH